MLKFFGQKLRNLFRGKIDEAAIEQLEQLFFEADLGNEISLELTDKVHTLYKKKPSTTSDEALNAIKEELIAQLDTTTTPLPTSSPHVILIVGVNGNGKTTSVAKLAHYFQQNGKSCLIAAADTFRAAATAQLEKWAEQLNTPLVKGLSGSDPAAVVFDAIEAAKARQKEIVLIDTAGRLHTKQDLMKELEKIRRVCGKAHPGSPHETLLVLDATIGQNAVEQAKVFHSFTPLTGLILTKMDGTARGGAAIAIQKKIKLPIQYIGTGEQLADLSLFESKSFVDALLES